MDFRLKNSQEFVGRTAKGNTVSFGTFNEDLFSQGCDKIDGTTKTNRFEIKCNFQIKPQMADLLESSKIMRVDEYSNTKKAIYIYPLFGFSLQRLTDTLHDMSLKFDL